MELKSGGVKSIGSILFWACEDKSQVIFPCKFEKSMKVWPVGSHIFMNSAPIFPGDKILMAIRYKCRLSQGTRVYCYGGGYEGDHNFCNRCHLFI